MLERFFYFSTILFSSNQHSNIVQKLLNTGGCDYINDRLGKSSGIFRAEYYKNCRRKKYQDAIRWFLLIQIGLYCCGHLALKIKQIVHCDFVTPLMIVENPVVGRIKNNSKGVIVVQEVVIVLGQVMMKGIRGDWKKWLCDTHIVNNCSFPQHKNNNRN